MATYQQCSQSYFVNDISSNDIVVANLTPEQHETNNEWFKSMLSMLKDDGELYVPCLNKSFNKLGEEINNHSNISGQNVGIHKLEPISYYDYRNKEEINNENW